MCKGERLVSMRKTTREAPSLLCRSPQDHMRVSLDLKGLVRVLDPPIPTFRLPTEQQPDVMRCILSLPTENKVGRLGRPGLPAMIFWEEHLLRVHARFQVIQVRRQAST